MLDYWSVPLQVIILFHHGMVPPNKAIVSFFERCIQLFEASRNYILASKSRNPTKQQSASSSCGSFSWHHPHTQGLTRLEQGQSGLEANPNRVTKEHNLAKGTCFVFSAIFSKACRWEFTHQPLSINNSQEGCVVRHQVCQVVQPVEVRPSPSILLDARHPKFELEEDPEDNQSFVWRVLNLRTFWLWSNRASTTPAFWRSHKNSTHPGHSDGSWSLLCHTSSYAAKISQSSESYVRWFQHWCSHPALALWTIHQRLYQAWSQAELLSHLDICAFAKPFHLKTQVPGSSGNQNGACFYHHLVEHLCSQHSFLCHKCSKRSSPSWHAHQDHQELFAPC